MSTEDKEMIVMLEIEAKYPLPDPHSFERRLLEWGASLVEQRTDADHYFNAPDRDFAQTDEAFRVRRIGASTFLTYKGPKIDRETKTREEIEVAVAQGDQPANDLIALVRRLGYRPVGVVRKSRRVFKAQRDGWPLQFCLDVVEKVGIFAEIEIVTEEANFAAAKAVLQRIAEELSLTQTERRSYLELLLTAQASVRES